MSRRQYLSIAAVSLTFPALGLADAIQAAPMQATVAETLPKLPITALEISPAEVKLASAHDYAQVLVTARLSSGDTADVTRFAHFTAKGAGIAATPNGILTPKADGNGKLLVEVAGKTTEVSLTVTGATHVPPIDFIQDVNPVLTKLGCNQGTCHGAKEGKYGFKLSLRGYDPLFDVRSLKDDLAGRRLNVASPDDSLMLLKATAGVPHEGGQRTKLGEKYYEILRAWIADGAQLHVQAPKVVKIEVFPKTPVVQEIGGAQQFRVVASFADGVQRDVTQEAFVESGNTDVAAMTPEVTGLVKTLRRGEAPVLARYEGNYAATTLTVMGDRTGFTWQKPETWSRVDELVAEKWQRMRIEPSGLCTDADFLRRVYLDLTGLPPSAEDVRAFLADATPTRPKRDAVIDKLIGSPEFIDHLTNKWCDLLQVNSKFLGGQGATGFREWIHKEMADNVPYDQFVHEILTASGSNKDHPAASYWKILREPAETMENTTHLFLATRFNCNKCHDHPFERWTQDQYYHLAAYFSQVGFADDPQSNGARIGGTAVEKSQALYELVSDKKDGEMIHLRTNKVADPQFPYPSKTDQAGASRREQLAAWMVSPDNRYFASSYVNRLWGYLLGVGLIEPLDDIRAGNPASNPELLDYLRAEFVNSKFDVRHVLRLICKSRTYQLAVGTNKWNADDKINYSHALARRLPAEVLYDSVVKVTGSGSRLPGGVRAGNLADAQTDLPSGFLANTGRPVRESACECERSSELRLGSVMALLSGSAVADAIGDPGNSLAKLVNTQADDRKLADEIFVRVLNRPATNEEVDKAMSIWSQIDTEHAALALKLEAKEKEQAPAIAKAEQARTAGIDAAKTELTRYEKEIAPKVAAAEKKQQADAAAAKAAMTDYETKQHPAGQEKFELSAPISRTYTGWQPLEIAEAKATGGIELAKQPDGSFKAVGARPKATDYVLKADTKLAHITGLMLEVMNVPDETNFGPGRAPDGNFVLTEFSLKVGDITTGANPVDAKFTDAIADFNQENFDEKKAIDGKKNDGNNGWAISPAYGQPHFAAFTLGKPVGDATKGVRLRIELHQPRDGGFSIGRFRLWVTTDQGPLYPGYPAAVAAALRKHTGRTDADKAALAAYWKENDLELNKRRLAYEKLLLPLPTDPGILQRRDAVAAAEQPIKLDATLVQLRADFDQSKAQIANRRLTSAQDLVWALVNTPAFLFNR